MNKTNFILSMEFEWVMCLLLRGNGNAVAVNPDENSAQSQFSIAMWRKWTDDEAQQIILMSASSDSYALNVRISDLHENS
jgi:hypothetical protein